MSLIIKLAFLFTPFIRLINLIKRVVSRYTRQFCSLEPSKTTFKLGSWNNEATVQTKYGMISGLSVKKYWCWKGISYATPPVGSLRWKAPLDPAPWIGNRKTKKFGNSAAQVMPFL
ncbi:MAG: carboxylesterase family protein, partial [Candidatus Heimdallarchaeota archaeon]